MCWEWSIGELYYRLHASAGLRKCCPAAIVPMRGVRRASTTQATAQHTGYCDGLRCSSSLLATPPGLPSANLAKARLHRTCCRSVMSALQVLSLHNLTCRNARRGEQASTSRVKGANGMPRPGRMPSAVPCGPWSERLQLGGVSRGAPPAIGGTGVTGGRTLLWNHVDD